MRSLAAMKRDARLHAAHAAQTADSSSHVDLHCHGYVDNVWDHVSADGILLLASNWEGFGLVAVEAMNRSYLLVASAVSGLQEVCEQDGQPLTELCDPQSVASIHAAIAASLQRIETGDYRARVAAAFQRSLEFSEEKMVAAYLAAYAEVARGALVNESENECVAINNR